MSVVSRLDAAHAPELLAFPQVTKSVALPMNPHGCWDWWGYTGDDYAWRTGAQQTVLVDWIRSLMD